MCQIKDTYDLVIVLTASDGMNYGKGKLSLGQIFTVTFVIVILKQAFVNKTVSRVHYM